MEKHDHPTARQRLGDVEAGLGAAATLTPADADAIREIAGVQFVSEGIHENVHAAAGDRRWFTRLHGGDVELPSIRRSWTFTAGRFFSAREQSRLAPVVGPRRVRRREAVRRRQPGRPRDSAVEAAVPDRRRCRQRQLDGGAGGGGRSVRRDLRAVHDDSQAAESLEAQRHHDYRGLDRRRHARCRRR